MATTGQNSQGVPTTNQPFVDKGGMITVAWYRFLITLWRRTGGSLENIPDTSSLAGVSNFTAQSNVNNLSELLLQATGIVISGPTSGTAKFFNVSGSVNLGFVGVGGLDVASSRVAGGVIYLFGISKTGNTLEFLLSSNLFPQLPSDYNYATVLGAYVLDGGGNFRRFVQKNDLVIYKDFITELTNQEIGQNVAFDFPVTAPPNTLIQANIVMYLGNSDPGANGVTGGLYVSPTFVPVNIVSSAVNGQVYLYYRGSGASLVLSTGACQLNDILSDENRKLRAVGYCDAPSTPELNFTTTGYRIPFIGLQGIPAT